MNLPRPVLSDLRRSCEFVQTPVLLRASSSCRLPVATRRARRTVLTFDLCWTGLFCSRLLPALSSPHCAFSISVSFCIFHPSGTPSAPGPVQCPAFVCLVFFVLLFLPSVSPLLNELCHGFSHANLAPFLSLGVRRVQVANVSFDCFCVYVRVQYVCVRACSHVCVSVRGISHVCVEIRLCSRVPPPPSLTCACELYTRKRVLSFFFSLSCPFFLALPNIHPAVSSSL